MKHALQEHAALFGDLGSLESAVLQAAQQIVRSLKEGGKVLLCGNGGSAADCQHIAAEMVGRFQKDRRGLAAVALTTDTSALTAIGNDFGFDQVFARQVQAIGRPGDCLLAISTSGDSENVVLACQGARQMGIFVIGLLGNSGGEACRDCDISIIVRSESTARIQEAHGFLGHVLCELIEQSF